MEKGSPQERRRSKILIFSQNFLIGNLWISAGSQRVLSSTTACGQRNLSILWVNFSGRGWDAGISRDPAVSHSWPAAGFLSC